MKKPISQAKSIPAPSLERLLQLYLIGAITLIAVGLYSQQLELYGKIAFGFSIVGIWLATFLERED